MNRLVAVVLLSAGCAAPHPAPESPARTVVHPDTLRMAELRRAAALALAKEEFVARHREIGLEPGAGQTCPMPVFRGDTAVAPMTVFSPDSSLRHRMVVLPPGCRPRGD